MFRAPGKKGLKLPEGMPASVMSDRWWLLTYGLTPSQVRELPLEDYQWLPVVEHAHRLAEERAQSSAEFRGRKH